MGGLPGPLKDQHNAFMFFLGFLSPQIPGPNIYNIFFKRFFQFYPELFLAILKLDLLLNHESFPTNSKSESQAIVSVFGLSSLVGPGGAHQARGGPHSYYFQCQKLRARGGRPVSLEAGDRQVSLGAGGRQVSLGAVVRQCQGSFRPCLLRLQASQR